MRQAPAKEIKSVITLAGCGFIQGLQCTQGGPLVLTQPLLLDCECGHITKGKIHPQIILHDVDQSVMFNFFPAVIL